MRNDLLNYIDYFMNRISLPAEGKDEILKAVKLISLDDDSLKLLTESKLELMSKKASFGDTIKKIGKLDKKLGLHEYTLHFIFLISCTDILLEHYKAKNIDESIFWDGMDDFRCKFIECHNVKGIWGTFVAGWYADWLSMKLFALGRLQYGESFFEMEGYNKNGIVVNKGDRVHYLHIPSSGQPFDKAARLASYRKAYELLGYAQRSDNMVLVCHSWLLYRDFENMLPPDSRILDFMRDFDIVSSTASDNFDDGWRIFGKDHNLPLEQLPRDTSLQKAVAEHLQAGGKMGVGFGIIVFDGEKIINH